MYRKMKRIIWYIVAVCHSGLIFAQVADTFHIEECYSKALLQYNGNRQVAPLSEASAYRIRNLNTRWLPGIGLNGQATYQSETVKMSTYNPVTGQQFTLELPLDQYKVQLEISQQIYDGGVTRIQKEMERNSLGVDKQQIEIDKLAFRQRISQYYFAVVLADKNVQILSLGLGDLRERKKVIESGVSNGVLISQNLDAILAEELAMMQKIADVEYTRATLIRSLSVLLDTTLSENTYFAVPVVLSSRSDSVLRPEYGLFDLQKEQLTKNQRLLTAIDMPKISAFSQVGYGRPGFDFLNTDLHDYYLVGIGLKWNFIKYGETKRQKKIIDLNKDIIDIRRDLFDENLTVMIENEKQNIARYNEFIVKDREIAQLRKAITASSFSQLTNGTITATNFLTDSNAEIQAKLLLENHEILLLQSIYNYLIIKGEI
jgi:outer membrane protein TolC